jgi:lipopolysaccharide export system permease protein
MKIIDRYLLKNYLMMVAYCMGAFGMIYIILELFSSLGNFIEADVPFHLIIRYYFGLLMPALEYISPASLFLGALYTLWHFSRNNELIAMRACGISFTRIMAPFLGVGLAFSIGNLAVKETIAPSAYAWAKDFSRKVTNRPEQGVKTDVAFYNPAFQRSWLIRKINLAQPNRIDGVKITQERGDGTRSHEIIASRAEWMDGAWWLFDVQIRQYTASDAPLAPAPASTIPTNVNMREFREFKERPADFMAELRPWDFLSAHEMRRYIKTHPHLTRENRAQKTFDFHHRLALAWSCLVVTLFALPVGAQSGRHNALIGLVKAVAIFFAFYGLDQIGMFLGKRMLIWPWLGAWLSNIIFTGNGIKMVFRMR